MGKVTHGDTKTRLYAIWTSMKQRCKNERTNNYHLYGGKGIRVCDEWQNYIPFKAWAMANGYESTLSIDRIDNSLGYSPSNCRWVTMKAQQNHRSNNHDIAFKGKEQTLTKWAEEIGVPVKALSARIIDHGWDIERALTEPLHREKQHKRERVKENA